MGLSLICRMPLLVIQLIKSAVGGVLFYFFCLTIFDNESSFATRPVYKTPENYLEETYIANCTFKLNPDQAWLSDSDMVTNITIFWFYSYVGANAFYILYGIANSLMDCAQYKTKQRVVIYIVIAILVFLLAAPAFYATSIHYSDCIQMYDRYNILFSSFYYGLATFAFFALIPVLILLVWAVTNLSEDARIKNSQNDDNSCPEWVYALVIIIIIVLASLFVVMALIIRIFQLAQLEWFNLWLTVDFFITIAFMCCHRTVN
jgi:hypothetical protein